MRFILILVIMFASCGQPTQTETDLRNTINKEVNLDLFDMVRQGNSFLSLDELRQEYDFLSVVYLQDGCQPCYPKFIEWQQKLDSIFLPENHSVLFVIQGSTYESFMDEVLSLDYVEDNYYTIMDSGFKFIDNNRDIPRWIIDASVLIDSENKIKMVGAPWINEDMKKLFLKTVSSNQ